jgi:hypothetical protein
MSVGSKVTAIFLMMGIGPVIAATAGAQTPKEPPPGPPAAQHDHARMTAAANPWSFMQDGVVYGEFNHQGTARGGSEFVVPNWWMGMASRAAGRGQLTLTSMFSVDPATVGRDGYRELFQSGEALDGRPLIDRQHPHDLFMQLAVVWRIPLNAATGLTLAGGPAGEPALGPVAFMHRASAADNPTAPLGHHTFDSTHVAFGVVTAAVDRGPFVVEASLFNGREPDQDRWDFDFGRLDSFSGRLWFRPTSEWEFQVSSGRLKEPEELEPGHDVVRSTASAAWTRAAAGSMAAVTVGFGRNVSDHGNRNALFAEAARQSGAQTLYGRVEALQLEGTLLDHDGHDDGPHSTVPGTLVALTLGAVRDVWTWRGFEGGVGADVTLYGVPETLRPSYSNHPLSFHVFFRLRPPAGAMGRMWNMRMSRPMRGHAGMAANHPMP